MSWQFWWEVDLGTQTKASRATSLGWEVRRRSYGTGEGPGRCDGRNHLVTVKGAFFVSSLHSIRTFYINDFLNQLLAKWTNSSILCDRSRQTKTFCTLRDPACTGRSPLRGESVLRVNWRAACHEDSHFASERLRAAGQAAARGKVLKVSLDRKSTLPSTSPGGGRRGRRRHNRGR